jgi:hypothetical protein
MGESLNDFVLPAENERYRMASLLRKHARPKRQRKRTMRHQHTTNGHAQNRPRKAIGHHGGFIHRAEPTTFDAVLTLTGHTPKSVEILKQKVTKAIEKPARAGRTVHAPAKAK